jgi:hypothetical protein
MSDRSCFYYNLRSCLLTHEQYESSHYLCAPLLACHLPLKKNGKYKWQQANGDNIVERYNCDVILILNAIHLQYASRNLTLPQCMDRHA